MDAAAKQTSKIKIAIDGRTDDGPTRRRLALLRGCPLLAAPLPLLAPRLPPLTTTIIRPSPRWPRNQVDEAGVLRVRIRAWVAHENGPRYDGPPEHDRNARVVRIAEGAS